LNKYEWVANKLNEYYRNTNIFDNELKSCLETVLSLFFGFTTPIQINDNKIKLFRSNKIAFSMGEASPKAIRNWAQREIKVNFYIYVVE
jgi:hypothetical protein